MSRARAAGGVVSKSLLSSVSTLGLLAATPAMAQDQDQDQPSDENEQVDEGDLIIVTGLRESLATSAAQKRNADTVVDVVTASDIGALPDRSVSEVLQRVPGVNVLRFAGANDPDHFAVEGSGVTVRGVPFVRSELNGRDVFGANSGGVLGFEDVSPELLGSVVIFKNQTADLIEGGLSGTIDLRTRLPLDSKDTVAFSLEGNYGDFAEVLTPTVSGLVSKSWDTDSGRFGVLFNAAYSRLRSRADAVSVSDFRETDYGNGTVYVPIGGGVRTQEFDRERLTIAGALQYESLDGRWLATAQFLRSDSDLVWGENVTESGIDDAGGPDSFDPSDFTFDENGVFESGTISDTDAGQWRGPNPSIFSPTGSRQLFLARERAENDITNDFGFNLKFAATDQLRFNFDAQYIDSSASVLDLTVHGATFAPLFIDVSDPNEAVVTLLTPDGFGDDFYQDGSNYYLRSAMDHITENEAESFAFRGDVEYDFSGDGWLKSVRAGARYSQQDRLLRQSDFNWGNISEVWTGNSLVTLAGNADPDVEALVSNNFGLVQFDNFNRQGAASAGLAGGARFYTGPLTEDYDGWVSVIEGIRDASGNRNGGRPFGGLSATLANRTPSEENLANGFETLIPGTPFFPSEVGNVNRDDFAAYIRLDWGSDFDSGASLTGNVGLRYVRSKREVDIVTAIPSLDGIFPDLEQCDPGFAGRSDPGFIEPGVCSEDLDALSAQLGEPRVITDRVDTDYDYFLPSFNVKLELPGGHIVRGAASRTLSRPGVDEIFQRVRVEQLPDIISTDGDGNTVATFAGFQGNGVGGSPTGNASLLPQLAWNFDLTYEYYFSRTGSITLSAFYKDIDNFITFAPVQLEAEGVNVFRNASVNAEENASLQGIEFAYTQFYDFLPGVLSGLGMQFNYTYIDADGVAAQLDDSLPAEDDLPVARFEIDRDVFPRVSEHNINAIALYEKGPVQARIAYNWRSEFQLTPRDVIFPFNSIYQPATGQVDASLFYDITDQFTIGVQAVNLLDDVTETTQTVNEEGLQAPRNFFRNDRRFTFILRGNF